jgi:hypothetical protein
MLYQHRYITEINPMKSIGPRKSRSSAAAPAAEEQPLTLSVPEAGRRYFGLGRVSSYEAAERGDIPTIRIGRLLRVPVRALERMLDDVAIKARA